MQREQLALAFHGIALEFVKNSAEAWPMEILLPIAYERIKSMSATLALDLFDSTFGPWVDKLTLKDEEALFEAAKVPALDALDIQDKYTSANESTKATIWKFIGELCKYSTMNKLYKHIPSEILSAVSETANSLKQQIEDGTVDTTNLNPFELGQQVVSKFDPKQIKGLMTSLMSNESVMKSMVTQVTGMLGQNNSKDVENALNGVDPSGLATMFQSLLGSSKK